MAFVIPVQPVYAATPGILTGVLLGVWVYRDAAAREGDIPLAWAVASVLTPIGLPYYLYRRYRTDVFAEREPVPTVDRLLQIAVTSSIIGFVLMSYFSPPDPTVAFRTYAVAVGIFLPLSFVLDRVIQGVHFSTGPAE